MNKYQFVVTYIVDGDTVEGDLICQDLGIVFPKQRLRFMWCNTPEREQEGYQEAKDFTASYLSEKTVTLGVYKKDAFGRWLTDVYISEDETLNQLLLKEGLAVPFKD